MVETEINETIASDLTNAITDYTVDSKNTDGAGSQKETTYQNVHWSEDYGYYNTIPEFKNAVDAKALWTMGAGFQADEPTTMLLANIKGNGKDSFNSILKNLIKVKTISKDSFAEIMRDNDKVFVNLKPLDPSSIVIVQNAQGRIIRYEQVCKHKTPNKRYNPAQIFHLSHDRMADSIHGTRIINSLNWLILARNEAMNDWQTVLHRNVRPMRIWYLDSDDPVKVEKFKAKTDKATADFENIYVPKGCVETDIISVSPNETLNPLNWIDSLNDYFYQAVMVPQILFGNAKGFTDASGKIVYLAHEQNVKSEQLYVEEQVLGQLNIEIQLTFPASLQMDTVSDTPSEMDKVEEEPMEAAAQPNDMTIEMEGKK